MPGVHELVRKAFRMARKKGKDRMIAAVLKNRMLLLSDGKFDETNYGFRSFREFVLSLNELLRFRGSEIEMIAPDPGGGQADMSVGARRDLKGESVRPDLWRAVMDYGSGHTFVLDRATGRAVHANPTDVSARLPTIARADLLEWRAEFAETNAGYDEGVYHDRLLLWKDDKSRAHDLPLQMRGMWNAELKWRVAERLKKWFAEQDLPLPSDLMERTQRPPSDTAAASAQGDATKALRDLVIECIAVMTHDELIQIALPSAVVLRARPVLLKRGAS